MTWDPIAEALFVDRAAHDPDLPVTPFVAMQRVVVRMLFDPDFVQRVYSDAASALAGLDVSPALVEQLLRNDRRLWQADRLRRSRSLKVLLEEFRVSSTLALAECRRLAFLDAFFGSAIFHEAVERRRYMALAFAAYLEEALRRGKLRSRHFAAALGIETSMARSRRLLRDARRGHDAGLERIAPGRPGARWVASPGTLAHFAPAGTLAVVQRIEKYLFEVGQVPALALCDDAPRPEPLPAIDEGAPVPFLLEPQAGGKVELSEIGEGYALVIAACQRPRDAGELAQVVAPNGIVAAEAREMAESLREAGVLRRVVVGEDGEVAPEQEGRP